MAVGSKAPDFQLSSYCPDIRTHRRFTYTSTQKCFEKWLVKREAVRWAGPTSAAIRCVAPASSTIWLMISYLFEPNICDTTEHWVMYCTLQKESASSVHFTQYLLYLRQYPQLWIDTEVGSLHKDSTVWWQCQNEARFNQNIYLLNMGHCSEGGTIGLAHKKSCTVEHSIIFST